MNVEQIRKMYLEKMTNCGHAIIPSSSLKPENDPTTLFTGSGMQSLIPFLMGKNHPSGTRLSNSQKCFRAEDIEEVGDNRHTTFFEMLGNWSLGDYFKKEQLEFFYDFLVTDVGLNSKNIYVTAFAGDEKANLPKDTESVEIWKRLFASTNTSSEVATMGSETDGGKRGMREDERIFYYDASKNWWSRAGKPDNMPSGEIGGPDSEVFYDFGTPHDPAFGEHCHPNCDCGRFIEIGNSVFMQYIKNADGTFDTLPKRNVDFGGGLERITAASNGDADVFKIDVFSTIIEKLESLSGKKYHNEVKAFRVVADHMRAVVFLIADGVTPGSKDQQYFVRRLLRRAIRYTNRLDVPVNTLSQIAELIIIQYSGHYASLDEQRVRIIDEIKKEEEQFTKTLANGLKIFEKLLTSGISGANAYTLFTTYGFPYELTEELAQERGITLDKAGFEAEMQRHQEASRAGSEQKFKGGLADNSEKVVMYHTATHLLLAGLRKVLGDHVHQAGSNITGERLRFDFTHAEKLDKDVLNQVEAYVNETIQKSPVMHIETLDKKEAEADSSIEGSFWEKYPDQVHVYTLKDEEGNVYSRELCGGPHVQNAHEIEGMFKIIKEESSAHGVRRIKAVLE